MNIRKTKEQKQKECGPLLLFFFLRILSHFCIMYSRQEASQLRQEFWTAFGLYMQPIPSAEGDKVNWINYKTGEKDIFFRMSAGTGRAFIALQLAHRDEGIRQIYYEQLLQFRPLLEGDAETIWEWTAASEDEEGRPFAGAWQAAEGVSIFRREDWPALISFFKPRLLELDRFWSEAKYVFETLR